MYRSDWLSVSLLALVGTTTAYARAPAEGEEEAAAHDPDEVAAEELVREIREEAENDSDEPAPGSLEELISLIEQGPPSADLEPSSEYSGEQGDRPVEDAEAPDE